MRPSVLFRLCSPIAQQPMPCVSALTRYLTDYELSHVCRWPSLALQEHMESHGTFCFLLDLLLLPSVCGDGTTERLQRRIGWAIAEAIDHVVIYALEGDSISSLQRFHGIGSDSKQQTINTPSLTDFGNTPNGDLPARLLRCQNLDLQYTALFLLPVGPHAVLPMCRCQ